MAMYDNENTVEKSFDLQYISPHLIQAQWAEFVELKKRITHLYRRQGRPISILDIGIGNGRIPMSLSGVKEMWQMVSRYHGTDNAQACVDITRENVRNLELNDKVSVTLLDALLLNTWPEKYDMVITTWFTAGNFYPPGFDFASYPAAGQRLDLSANETFTQIFKNAYNLLLPGGEVVIGACYLDNDSTRQKQEESYRKMGMTVITTDEDSFTATLEGFWSQRFTRQKLESYLDFVDGSQVEIVPLDTYDYAMQVTIKKP